MILNPIIYKPKLNPYLADADFTYTSESVLGVNKVTITGFNYTGDEENVTIPQYIDGMEVIKIKDNALNTGSFGNIKSVTIPFQITWVTTDNENSVARINPQIVELEVVNLPNPLPTAFFKGTTLTKLVYENTPTQAYGRCFYGANLNCSGIINLIKGLTILKSSYISYTNTLEHFYNASTGELDFDELTSAVSATSANVFANCSIYTIKLPKLTSLVKNFFGGYNGYYASYVRDIYLDTCTAIDFGTSESNSPFRGMSNLTHIYTTTANLATLKAIFANAPYTSGGSNLESLVTAYD